MRKFGDEIAAFLVTVRALTVLSCHYDGFKNMNDIANVLTKY
jgi:hypothetical protein